MNKSVKMILAGATIIALSANAFAHDDDCGYRHGPMGMDPARMEKMHEQRMAALHDKLKLTAQQEPAWKKFAVQQPMPGQLKRPDPAEMDKLNAPQRLEKGLEHLRAMEARLAEHLAALKEFYAVLTPEQQKTFDDQMPRFGGRWAHRDE